MTDFDIINALETYATANNMYFIYANVGTKGDFERNLQLARQQANSKLILMCDVVINPSYTELGKRTGINYDCLVMIGNKFDASGNAAELSETHKQKYDRRILPLFQAFDTFIKNFTCTNSLQVTINSMTPEINVFDTNIDMVVSSGLRFTQL